MIRFRITYMLILLSLLMSSKGSDLQVKDTSYHPVTVTIKEEAGRYKLYRDGQEYFIKGAGCEHGNIAALAKHGANSFRTWRTNNGRQTGLAVLDSALKYNLTVSMGLDIGRERHGFDYDNSKLVQKQFEEIKNQIIEFKDHPALLIWVVGNELNLRAKNPKVWDAVNEIAQMIHEIDPYHPVATTIAGADREDIQHVKTRCPHIDVLGIQLYGKVIHLPEYIAVAEWTGPYIVTEWGPTGHWESERTIWNRPIEQTSSQKRKSYVERYNIAIASDPDQCIGSYAFLWGYKQERTPTWYGMFLETGEETASVDAMHFIWNGKWPDNLAPELIVLTIDNKVASENIILERKKKYRVHVEATDENKQQLFYRWEIRSEVTELSDGGDFEKSTPNLKELFVVENDEQAEFIAPHKPGEYRVFVYVIDEMNNAATANIPFKVI
jgi:hypothetical protein